MLFWGLKSPSNTVDRLTAVFVTVHHCRQLKTLARQMVDGCAVPVTWPSNWMAIPLRWYSAEPYFFRGATHYSSIKTNKPSEPQNFIDPYDICKQLSSYGLWWAVWYCNRTVRAPQKAEHVTVYGPVSWELYSHRSRVQSTALGEGL